MDQTVKLSYKKCAQTARSQAKNFYFGFITLPYPERMAIYAIYDFCRQADDIADGNKSISEKEELLGVLRQRLRDAARGEPEPIDLAFADAIRRFRVDPNDLLDVVAGVQMDLTKTRYETFSELRDYCYHVASAVGMSVLPILAGRQNNVLGEHVRKQAESLGIGLQLANIVRDVAEDVARDRIYIPKEDMDRFGVVEEDIKNHHLTENMKRLLSFQINRARDYMGQGEQLLHHLPRRSRSCPALLLAIYQSILEVIEQRGYDVFSSRASLSTTRKLLLTLRTTFKGTP